MDPLDFAVYRYLSPRGEASFWAGRRVIDPRVTPREIAERVGLSESGTRSRLQRLAERGFLRDRVVVANPSLFDAQVFVSDLAVRRSGEVDRILRDLALVEGVLFARDVMDEAERKIQVHFASQNDASASRLAALLERIGPAGTAVRARPYRIPPHERELTRLEWRVLRALSRLPDATYAQVAESVRISPKTAARVYHRLLDSRACWWTHGPESEEFPLALVRAELRGPGDREPLHGWLGRATPAWMPVASDGLGLEPDSAPAVLAGLVPADVPTALERFLRSFAAVEGVLALHRTFPLGSTAYPSWLAERLAEKAKAAA